MNVSKKLGWFLFLVACYTTLGGMVCGRAIDISVLVKNTSKFRFSLVNALADAGIPAKDGKIPEGIRKKLLLEYVDKIDLVNNERSKEVFQQYGDRIHSVYINRVWLTVEQNQLKTDLPSVKVNVASLNASKFDEGHIATFPALGAGQKNVRTTLLWEPKGFERAQELLQKYGLQIRLFAPIEIRGGMPYPKRGEGILDFRLQMEVTFVLKAI